MGFRDKLYSFNPNQEDPLFGGLIPRRVISEAPERQQLVSPVVRRSPVVPDRQIPNIPSGMSNSGMSPINGDVVGRKLPGPYNPLATRNVVFDWTEQELGMKRRAIDQADRRLAFEEGKFGSEHELEQEKLRQASFFKGQDLLRDDDRIEIDRRKQALDEWVKQNPEGEVKELENGELVVIDKRTGKATNTGLKGGNMSEEEKLRIGHNYRMSEIAERNRLATERERGRTNSNDRINPSQQRIAEDDAAVELLRDSRYSFLKRHGIIKLGDKGIEIDYSKMKEGADPGKDWTEHIKQFEKELKEKSNERMNKFSSRPGTEMSSAPAAAPANTVEMVDKFGNKLTVPMDKVEYARTNGARMPGEVELPPQRDSIVRTVEDGKTRFSNTVRNRVGSTGIFGR